MVLQTGGWRKKRSVGECDWSVVGTWLVEGVCLLEEAAGRHGVRGVGEECLAVVRGWDNAAFCDSVARS